MKSEKKTFGSSARLVVTIIVVVIMIADPFLLFGESSKSGLDKEPRIEIITLPDPVIPAGMKVVRWVKENDTSWKKEKPFFVIMDSSGTVAQGWLAANKASILLKVIVNDETHLNEQTGSNIGSGDCLRIGIDARGDGSGKMPADSRLVDQDDASITLALTNSGPAVWANYQGKYGSEVLKDGSRKYPCVINRNKGAKTTTYEVSLPWDELLTHPGQSPFLGMTVQVVDNRQGNPSKLYSWGRGIDGMPRPGLFERLALGNPPEDVCFADATRNELWQDNSYGEMSVVTACDENLKLQCTFNGIKQEKDLGKQVRTGGVKRFLIRAYPGVLPETPLDFSVDVQGEGRILASATARLFNAGAVVGQLHERLLELIASSPHPLLTENFRSIDLLVNAEWNHAMFVFDQVPAVAKTLVIDARTILDKLNSRGGEWQTYTRGEKSLVIARYASPDCSIQYYNLTLPDNWDEGKEYPLIVSMHGMASANPLAYVAGYYSDQGRMRLNPQEQNDGQYYSLHPWGRGNSGYREWGENDIFEAIADVKKRFKINKDKVYLSGFSMGGGGTWSISLRTPDQWAAICPTAGMIWNIPKGIGIEKNLQHMPIRIIHGDKDLSVPVQNAYDIQAELRKYGNDPVMVIIPGGGHGSNPEANAESIRWMLRQTRKRPDNFSFVADGDKWRGIWGIRMKRDLAVSALPRFECDIKGTEVRIKSEGTTGLSVNTGPDGLNLNGNISLFWNDKKIFEGPVIPGKEIILGDGAGTGRFSR